MLHRILRDEIVPAFAWREAFEQPSCRFPRCLDGPFCGSAHQLFEFCEDLLDRVQIGTVGRQEEELGSCFADGRSRRLALVRTEIVHDDDVAGSKCGYENLIDIERDALGLNRRASRSGTGRHSGFPNGLSADS